MRCCRVQGCLDGGLLHALVRHGGLDWNPTPCRSLARGVQVLPRVCLHMHALAVRSVLAVQHAGQAGAETGPVDYGLGDTAADFIGALVLQATSVCGSNCSCLGEECDRHDNIGSCVRTDRCMHATCTHAGSCALNTVA
jgi:hypothetical protein